LPPSRSAASRPASSRPATYDKKVALVLQGGGALGSYQAGAYEAIAHSDYAPDWVAGISIGAINAALIAGNAPGHRVQRLRDFWEAITTDAPRLPSLFDPGIFDTGRKQAAAMQSLLFGQPGFFSPRPQFGQTTSFYDTAPLRQTLERLVDFDRINARAIAFSVAAVNVRTGNFAWFDNRYMKIRPEHVMASGALPPGFPPVEIDGEHYWDGGLVSNTPLQYVIDHSPRSSRLVFQVDLFAARGTVPTTLDEVSERDKDIRYSSRTRAGDTAARDGHDVRFAINELWEKLPLEIKATPEAQRLYEYGCITTMDVAQLIYRPAARQGASKDYEFSRQTMQSRWNQGHNDATATLDAAPWLTPIPPGIGARSFDVLRPDGGN
jgi:NTE family protein